MRKYWFFKALHNNALVFPPLGVLRLGNTRICCHTKKRFLHLTTMRETIVWKSTESFTFVSSITRKSYRPTINIDQGSIYISKMDSLSMNLNNHTFIISIISWPYLLFIPLADLFLAFLQEKYGNGKSMCRHQRRRTSSSSKSCLRM